MAASRSMLESLLERVRQRAAEPRAVGGSVAGNPVAGSPAVAAAAALGTPQPAPVATKPPPVLTSAPAREVEEEVEEYDDELIEIIDDGDVDSDSQPEPPAPERAPLELSASVPSVEMRRHVVAAPSGSPSTTSSAPRPPASAPVAELRPEPLRAEAVSRRPVTAQVVHTQGARVDLARGTFIELLDASLRLGR